MAWRYSPSSYTPRDRSSSRDTSGSKYGLGSSSYSSSYTSAERPSRWSTAQSTRDANVSSRSSAIEEHGPVWAKTSLHTSPSSLVQRLKDKYSTPETKSTPSPVRRGETKDLSLPISRTYGRTLTTNYTGKTEPKKEEVELDSPKPAPVTSKPEPEKSSYMTRSSFRKKSPEPEKTHTYEYKTRVPDYTPLESKPKVYTSSSLGSSPATSRFLGNKKGSGSSAGSTPNTPTTPITERNFILEKFERAYQQEHGEKSVNVVTRATSPTQPSTSIYVRARRADSSRTIEKTVTRPKIPPITADKECQAGDSTPTKASAIFSTYDVDKVKARPSYLGSTSALNSSYSPGSRYTPRTSNYTPLANRAEFRRSVSKDRENEVKEFKEPNLSKAPPVSYTPVSVRSELRRSLSRDRDSEPYVSHVSSRESKGPPVSYTPLSRYNSEFRRSLSRERDFNAKRSEEITQPVKAVTVRTIDTPKISPSIVSIGRSSVRQSATPISPTPTASESSTLAQPAHKLKSPTPTVSESAITTQRTLTPKSPTPTVSESTTLKSKTKSISSSTSAPSPEKSATPKKTSEKSNLSSRQTPEDKSKSPAKSDGRERARSKTQESDTSTSISVSGFSDVTKSKSPSAKNTISKTSASPQTVNTVESSESESESESDETATTTTDSDTGDEAEELTKSSEPSSVKKSITNFLQNRPSGIITAEITGSRSRPSFLKNTSAAKIKFTHVDSGERAWWMDSNSNVPDGVVRLVPSNKALADKNHLVPNILPNRQFSRDKDWLRNSSDEGSDRSSISPLPPRPPSVEAPHQQHPHEPSNQLLDVPKLPVLRQWSDEKPWWLAEDESQGSANCDVQETANGHVCDSVTQAGTSPAKSSSGKLSSQADEDGLDVTPALRRRREQQQAGLIDENVQDYQVTELEAQAATGEIEKTFLEECKLECSVRDLTQKLAAVTNGVASPQEERPNLLEAEDMSGMISRAKAGLIKSQTKQVEKEEDDTSSTPAVDIAKSEIDIYWKELIDSLDRPLQLGDLDFTDLNSDDEQDIFGNSRVNGGIPPPPPPIFMNGPAPPPTPGLPPPMRNPNSSPPATPIVKNKKTVKLFWKEVADMKHINSINSVWDEIVPVPIDHAKLEHLFESRAKDMLTKKQQDQNKTKAIVVLDNKRSNAINIGMTKLPPPRAIKAAILKMDSSVVTKEGIDKLLSMLPTEEERVRIQDAQAANPEQPLGTAEQFLLTLASISELEARLRLWAFKMDFESSEREICEPLQDLKQGVQLLRANKTFQGILSTLLSIGNFLNGQEAKGFQIDYLSKVPEVKDTVNKHSLIHHLCVFVMENFPDSTDLYSEIGAVTRASKTDFDELSTNLKKLEEDCKCSWNHLKIIAKHEGQTAMKAKMSDFLADCAERIILIGIVHRRIMCRFRKFTIWLGVPLNRISTTRPQELFRTIAEFALEYRTTRERILQQMKRVTHHREKSKSRAAVAAVNNSSNKKLSSKEATEDAKLRQLLDDRSTPTVNSSTATWRRHRQKAPIENATANGDDSEIIATLIKTAKQPAANRESVQERRRSRMLERKISQT